MMHTLSYKLISALFLILLTLLSGCSEEASSSTEPVFISKTITTPEYAFAVHPLHNPTRLFEVFNPLVEYLNQHIPEAHFRVEASRDYATFNQKLKNSAVAFALPNPYQTLMAIDHHYHVIAKMGDDENFKGIILVRKDSDIRTPADLIGKAVSYPAPTALAATMLPQDYLQKHGLNINRDIQNRYVGSQESSIMNVFIGATAAGATWPPPWRALSNERPELKEQLKVIWQTESLPNNSVVVRDDIPTSIADKVSTLLTRLHTTEEGQTILKGMYLSRYEPADNSTYQPVKDFVTQFSERVRPLN